MFDELEQRLRQDRHGVRRGPSADTTRRVLALVTQEEGRRDRGRRPLWLIAAPLAAALLLMAAWGLPRLGNSAGTTPALQDRTLSVEPTDMIRFGLDEPLRLEFAAVTEDVLSAGRFLWRQATVPLRLVRSPER